MKRTGSVAVFFMVLLVGLIVGSFSSFNITSAGKMTATVTYNYYVVAGFNVTPSPPPVPPSPAGFNFACTPDVFNFGNITKWGGRTYIYDGLVDSPYEDAHGYTGARVNITNLLGYNITITSLTAEVTAGTPTLEYWFNPAGRYFGNFTVVWFDALDAWLESTPPDYRFLEDECNYTTGEVAVRELVDGDGRTKAVGTPYPEGFQTGTGSLLEPDWLGDAAATGHVAPLSVANGATFTEYFGVAIFGDVDVGTQITGTITLSLTYEYTMPGSPVASFTYSPTDPTVNETVTFNASTSTPDGGNLTDPDSYVWDFGDGTNGKGKIANHTYTTPGTYAVVLNVTDSEEKWNSASKSVTVRSVPKTILVPDNFTSIQEAINNANDGDTVFVRADTYYENVVVNNSVSLVGENKETTIIDGNMSRTFGVAVEARDVLITNFTIRNGVGVEVRVGRGNTRIINNMITNNSFSGIWQSSSANAIIAGNNITNNGYGLYIFGSNNTISENYISNNTLGILGFPSDSTVSGNVLSGNKFSLFVLGDPTVSIDVSNLVNGKPVYYLVNQKDLVINSSTYPEVGYLALVNCSNIVVEGLTLTNNGQGLLLAYTNNSRITGNNVTENTIGILLQSSHSNNISGNNVTNNMYGVSVEWSNNTITGNNLKDNQVGGVLLGGSNNTVVENVFVNCGLMVGFEPYDIYGNLVENNTVNDKPLAYLEGVSDYTVVEGAGQVVLVNSNRIRVENLTLSNATVGVQLWRTNNTMITRNTIANNTGGWPGGSGVSLWYSYNNTITGNNIKNCSTGVHLTDSPNNMISENKMKNNSVGIWVHFGSSVNTTVSDNTITHNKVAIQLWSDGVLVERNSIVNNDRGVDFFSLGRNNIVRKNNVSRNGKGIVLSGMGSSDNQIYHNNFVDNEIQVELPTEYPPGYPYPWNTWDNGYPSGGNYWSDYNGTDLSSGPHQNVTGSDGIGDVQYEIAANNIDKYPLMSPISFFNVGTWNETTYYLDTVSNSTVSDVYFNPDEGPFIKFNVTGPDETFGFCRATVPNELLWCDSLQEWQIWVNNTLIEDRKIMEDVDYTYIYFTYNHTTQNVEVIGVHVIPEFPSLIFMPLFMTATLLAVVVYRRKHAI